jgi:hypothetical protein
MRRIAALLLTIGLFLVLHGERIATAQTPATPTVTSFTTTSTVVDRAALNERTARIPVSWVAINRPLTANLFFEQVLPDGSVVNVELPRTIPWVNSSGNGMAAPISPGDSATEIRLRVRLVNLLNGTVLSERELRIPIGTGGGTGPGNNNRPAITRFVSSVGNVRSDQLANGTARIPVSWTAVNRSVSSNLIFEQILTDGSVVNVELPRENPWVASSGNGVAAPVTPGGNATSIRLRVRLIDLLNGRVLDQRELTLTIGNTPPPTQPRITTFTTTFVDVSAGELASRTARVPVSWAVENRPDSSNLVFEQVLPGGAIINVELPRQNPYVSSSGNGVAAPVLPAGSANIVLRVRLVDLSSGATIDTREITLPIRGAVQPTVTPTVTGTPPATATTSPTIQIRSFTVNPTTIERGGSVTFTWDVVGVQTVNLTRLAEQTGVYTESLGQTLPAQGSLTYTIPNTYVSAAQFILLLNNSPINQTVNVSISCPFTEVLGTRCPITHQTNVSFAYQAFENGHMFWRGDTRQIYILYNDGTFQTVQDTWVEGDVFGDGRTPPDGRFVPERGFGKVWFTQAGVSDRLGWATAQESSYTSTLETYKYWRGHTEFAGTAFRLPGGGIVTLEDRYQIAQ